MAYISTRAGNNAEINPICSRDYFLERGSNPCLFTVRRPMSWKNIANTASQAASDALARVQEPAKKCEKNTAAARHIVLKRNIRLFGETIPLGEIKSVSLTR
jgi:hypothetical protein